MDKIIVTGGMGYIGSHTTVRLLEENYEVVIVDNLINASEKTLDGIEEITGKRPIFAPVDLTHPEGVRQLFRTHSDAKAVIHFAALKAVKESVDHPLMYYRNNVTGMINMLDAMIEFEVSNLVFSSSATVYGNPDSLPLTEKHPTKPALSPYGNTKKMGENIIKDVVRAHDHFRAISLRYFNPIGAHESGKIGELPSGIPNNLMPFITQTAVGIRKELLVFGDDYNTPDGTAVRDYIHVVDLADAHVKTVQRMLSNAQKANYEVFNLGTGKGSSVLEVIQSFEKTSGQKLNYRIVARRDGDVEQMYAATDLANEELQWKAQYDLDDMTASSWNWEKHVRGI
jgi:UDP-glucose 4-epimerase